MRVKNILQYTPFGCFYYFHQQKDRFLELIQKLDEVEMKEAREKYKKTANKFLVGLALSLLPGGAYLAYTGNPIPTFLSLFIGYPYSELIFGKVIEGWIKEYEK